MILFIENDKLLLKLKRVSPFLLENFTLNCQQSCAKEDYYARQQEVSQLNILFTKVNHLHTDAKVIFPFQEKAKKCNFSRNKS